MRTAVKTAFFMVILTFVSKCFGFIREMVMANFYGTSFITDVYVMSSNILIVLFGGIITAISTAYIPIYSKIAEQKGEAEGDCFTSRVISILLIITVVISAIGILFSSQIVSIFIQGFSGETARLASVFIKILFSYVIFSAIAGIVQSYLQYKGIFLPQIISGYFVSICAIAVIIISAYTNYYLLPFGLLIGYLIRCIVMMLFARKKCNMRLQFQIKSDASIRELALLALPTFISSYMVNINQYVNKTLASFLPEGSISALNYASLLNNMIMGVTITILSTIIYPKLIKANSLDQIDKTNQLINTGMNLILIIALPCSLGCMLYSKPIIQIVYERGVFDSAATAITSSAFFFYSAGLLFMSCNALFTKIFYSRHNTTTPMMIAGFTILLNIGLNLILVRFLAHDGLALATTIATFINTVMLFAVLKRKYPSIKVVQSKKKLISILLAAVISVGFSYPLFSILNVLSINIIIKVALTSAFAAIVYLCILLILKIDEIYLLKHLFKRNQE
jgi:putative peptidoglycan lipid II flippase